MTVSAGLPPVDLLPESERNRRLRRADWRYLLPEPAPEHALCLAGGELRAACEIVARRTDHSPRSGEAYDLVVAENPDEAALRTLRAALAPGGACYTEWTPRGPGAPGRVRARLVRAGFHAPAAFGAWPSADRARAWLPTEGAAARHYWRSAVRSTPVRRERGRELLGATLARLGMHPRLGVVAHASPDAAREPALVRMAREHGVDVSGGMRLATHGERAVGKIVAIAFDAAGTASVAIKTARTADAARGVTREGDVLDAVHTQRSDAPTGVPRVLFRGEAAGMPVLGETAHTGVPLFAMLDRVSYEALADRVERWCARLAEGGGPAEPVWPRLAAPVFERFAAEFGAVVGAERLARTRALLEGIGELPVVPEQRDLSPWNVLVDGDQLAVLDWESADPRGVPGLDLLYYLTHAPYYVERTWVTRAFEESYRRAWSPSPEIGRANLRVMSRHLERLGVHAAVLPRLRVLAWALHAHSDWVHLRDDAGGTPGADQLVTSRFLRLYLAELETPRVQ